MHKKGFRIKDCPLCPYILSSFIDLLNICLAIFIIPLLTCNSSTFLLPTGQKDWENGERDTDLNRTLVYASMQVCGLGGGCWGRRTSSHVPDTTQTHSCRRAHRVFYMLLLTSVHFITSLPLYNYLKVCCYWSRDNCVKRRTHSLTPHPDSCIHSLVVSESTICESI